MVGHNDLLDALGATGAGRERLDDGLRIAHQLKAASSPGVVRPGAIQVGARLPAANTSNSDAGQHLLDPSAYGYPDETNTGVNGVGNPTLTSFNGKIDVADDGLYVDDVLVAARPGSGSTVYGPVTLTATSTTFYRADITGSIRNNTTNGSGIVDLFIIECNIVGSGRSNTIYNRWWQHCQMSDSTVFGPVGVTSSEDEMLYFQKFTVLRCDLSGGEELVRLGGNSYYEDCYLHDMRRDPGTHNDIFQNIGGENCTITHCTILAAKQVTADYSEASPIQAADGTWWDPFNACLQVGATTGLVYNLLVDDCLMDGGNYTISFNAGNQATLPITDVTIQNCRFGRHCRYGIHFWDGIYSEVTWVNNVWDDTGVAIPGSGTGPPP